MSVFFKKTIKDTWVRETFTGCRFHVTDLGFWYG